LLKKSFYFSWYFNLLSNYGQSDKVSISNLQHFLIEKCLNPKSSS
jgi:hypothetical protein